MKGDDDGLRLSLTLTYLEWASNHDAPEPYEVMPENVERAITLIDSYLTPMAERAFGSASKTDADQNTIMLANWIVDNQPERLVVRDIQRSGPFPSNIKSDDIKKACMALTGLNWLKPDFVRQGENAGRQQVAFLVNPTL